jgi:hypothetical protein
VPEDQQAEVLAALFREQGCPATVEPGGQDAGESARQLLQLLAESDDQALLDKLDRLLARPPRAATGGGEFLAVLEAARPIILTACLVILTTRFKFKYKDVPTWHRAGHTDGGGQRDGVIALDVANTDWADDGSAKCLPPSILDGLAWSLAPFSPDGAPSGPPCLTASPAGT